MVDFFCSSIVVLVLLPSPHLCLIAVLILEFCDELDRRPSRRHNAPVS